MKIAFTTSGDNLNAPLDFRFNKASRFLVYDLASDSYSVVDNPHSMGPAPRSGIHAAQIVARTGAKCLVTGHCGPQLYHLLCAVGVKMYNTDAPSVAAALEQYRAGNFASDVAGYWG